MKLGSLFSGYGGLEMSVNNVLGSETAWVSDVDKGANKILAHRYPGVPNLGDITKIDWATVEPIEVLTGGFPCTDLSKVGRRAGLRPGTRSGLWSHMAYAIATLRPRLVVAENVRGLLSGEASSDLEPCPWCLGDARGCAMRALGVVLSDLAELGYDAQWTCIRASDVGAPHERERVFLTASPADPNRVAAGPRDIGMGSGPSEERRRRQADDRNAGARAEVSQIRATHSAVDSWGEYAGLMAEWRDVTGHAAPALDADLAVISEWMMGLPPGWVTDVPDLTRNEALKAIGNGVCPQQAEAALRAMLGHLEVAA